MEAFWRRQSQPSVLKDSFSTAVQNVTEWLALLRHIWEISGPNFGLDTGYTA
jgi:hypothetical protein